MLIPATSSTMLIPSSSFFSSSSSLGVKEISNMQHLRNSILRHVRLGCPPWQQASTGCVKPLNGLTSYMCTSANTTGSEHLMARVIELVKKFDKTEASKVTETADFQKDLSLDSLDRVELVMAFEQEFSIEIPEEKADKLCCCTDVVKYISEAQTSSAQSS